MEHTISILIVEDEEIWMYSLSKMLEDFGFAVAKIVSTVDDALSAFSNCEYDLILMDINLGGKNSGIELGRIVNKLYKKPFIYITASHGHEIRDAASANPSAYLPKPINSSSLYIAIQNAINNFSNYLPSSQYDDIGLDSFFVKHGNRYKKVSWKDVAYISAGKNYIGVFNTTDKTEYFIRSSLQKTMQHLIPKSLQKQFIQINRAEVVQFSFILEVMNDEVKTAYKSFPVSEGYGKDLRNRLNIVS